MERRAKVELFEELRREYEFGIGSVRAVAKKLGVHRRMVRQALADARPPERKRAQRGQYMGMGRRWQRSSPLQAPRSRSLRAGLSLLPKPQMPSSRRADAAVPMRATSAVPTRSAGVLRQLPPTSAESIFW